MFAQFGKDSPYRFGDQHHNWFSRHMAFGQLRAKSKAGSIELSNPGPWRKLILTKNRGPRWSDGEMRVDPSFEILDIRLSIPFMEIDLLSICQDSPPK